MAACQPTGNSIQNLIRVRYLPASTCQSPLLVSLGNKPHLMGTHSYRIHNSSAVLIIESGLLVLIHVNGDPHGIIYSLGAAFGSLV